MALHEQLQTTWTHGLQDGFYDPDDDALDFFKKETGIADDAELKQHIITIQREAFSVFPYPCIRIFAFTWMKLARLPGYASVLKLGRERKDAIFLDVGCCFGNDSRKLVQDGYPIQNVVATDIRKGLWDLGHKLFRSTPDTYPVRFLEGDILDPRFLAVTPPLRETPTPSALPVIGLKNLASLNPLRGRVAAIYAGTFFHLFSADQQHQIAKLLAGLLSPESGSIILGVHNGATTKGYWQPNGTSQDIKLFCHNPESWAELWHEVFRQGQDGDSGVVVQARLTKANGGNDYYKSFPGNTNPFQVLEWSVTRK